jgi:hypothetical protein
VAAGVVDPGNLVVVRELVTPTAAQAAKDVDTAVFSDVRSSYTVTTTGGTGVLGSAGSVTTVVHNVPGGAGEGKSDGTDTLRNVERLVFSDSTSSADLGAPTIGTATAGDARATVRFTASVVGEATSFSVKVLDAAGRQVGPLRTVAAPADSLVVTGLTNGTAYQFQVSATSATGTSDYSAASTPVTPATLSGPARIGAVIAAKGQVTLSWAAPQPVLHQAPVTGYSIRTYVGSATTPQRTTAVANVTSAVIDILTNGTGYTFDVRAVNAIGTGPASARSAVATPRTEFTAPTVKARTPASGATAVSQTSLLTTTFSEPVTGVSTTTVTLRLGTTVVPATVTYQAATRTATLDPRATLAADRTYTATLSGIRDEAGNPLAVSSWSFTTGPAPTITTRSPGSGATNVRRDANLTATFSEAVTGVSTTSARLTRLSDGAVVKAATTLDSTGRVLTINPATTLAAGTRYRVSILGGSTMVRDKAGNPTLSVSWLFTTGSSR